VVGDGEGELKPVPQSGIIHMRLNDAKAASAVPRVGGSRRAQPSARPRYGVDHRNCRRSKGKNPRTGLPARSARSLREGLTMTRRLIAGTVVFFVACGPSADPSAAGAKTAQASPLPTGSLDELLAPIALYPTRCSRRC
jgi:hypothetical protein